MTWARMTSFSKWKLKADKLNPSNINVGNRKIFNPRGVSYREWAQLPSLFLKLQLLAVLDSRNSTVVL